MREIKDPRLRSKEFHIRRIQQSYGYDRENAEKLYELMEVKAVELLWGTACGTVAAVKAAPIQKELQHSFGIFRKPWMRFPLQFAAFSFAYYVGIQIPPRLLSKLSAKYHGVNDEYYQSKADLVGRFRLFDKQELGSSEEDRILDHIAMYSSDPLTKPEIVDHLMKRVANKVDLSKIFQIKRVGADADPLFWSFGKIHGLENIAFADPEEIRATEGNPIKLQKVVNKYNGASRSFSNVDQIKAALNDALISYKEEINKMEFNTSDRKKLLALPFYLAKRTQLPEPRRGQKEFELFTELTGQGYYDDAMVREDPETKITLFDFEKYLSPELLKNVDTDSQDFKTFVKLLNFSTRTEIERLEDNKEAFKQLMPVLSYLNEEEQRALIHYLQNNERSKQPAGRERDPELYDDIVSKDVEKKLAQISEEENYMLKNRYRFQKKVMNFADPSRMPTDERTIKDLLRNQHIFRAKINKEVPTYTDFIDNPQFENGLLTYLNEAAAGEHRDFIKDIGLNDETIPFHNYARVKKAREQQLHASDPKFHYLMNALFTPLDMTDYQEQFVGYNEIPGTVPISNTNWLMPLMPERHPQTDCLAEIVKLEKKPIQGTSSTMLGNSIARAADVEEEEYTGYGAEEEEDEDYDEEGEGEEGEGEGEEEYGDYGDYGEEVEEWNPKEKIASIELADRFFLRGDKLRKDYNEVELGNFMKLLNIKPHKQWQDESDFHYKLGLYRYEDDSQELDPAFHTLSEVERVHAEKQKVREWRSGSEVKFTFGDKTPTHRHRRF